MIMTINSKFSSLLIRENEKKRELVQNRLKKRQNEHNKLNTNLPFIFFLVKKVLGLE